mmetsp:Transcript_72442/g.120761  ORF Transcript_72442/g.120761 Transcript_72442/m.120761 type:complete len:163 (+) Transcript_72442:19-507(+)
MPQTPQFASKHILHAKNRLLNENVSRRQTNMTVNVGVMTTILRSNSQSMTRTLVRHNADPKSSMFFLSIIECKSIWRTHLLELIIMLLRAQLKNGRIISSWHPQTSDEGRPCVEARLTDWSIYVLVLDVVPLASCMSGPCAIPGEDQERCTGGRLFDGTCSS